MLLVPAHFAAQCCAHPLWKQQQSAGYTLEAQVQQIHETLSTWLCVWRLSQTQSQRQAWRAEPRLRDIVTDPVQECGASAVIAIAAVLTCFRCERGHRMLMLSVSCKALCMNVNRIPQEE